MRSPVTVERSWHSPRSTSFRSPSTAATAIAAPALVEIKHLGTNKPYGLALTEKEKEMLRQLGKIPPAEIENAETNDMPPRYRLACQYFVRDEDIAVIFAGDETLPKARPA